MAGITEANRKISATDKQIDVVTRALHRLEGIEPMDSGSWQNAWDKHPDMKAKFDGLYRQRGDAQQERAIAEMEAARRGGSTRIAKPKKCPTCKCFTLHATAA